MTKTNKVYNFIEQQGIPVVINGDWLEKTPLGRAEWIKFFGVLLTKKRKLIKYLIPLNQIILLLLKLQNNRNNSFRSYRVLLCATKYGIYLLGKAFVAQFLKDANLDYLWKDTEGKGSLNLGFEHVFEKGQNADFWIAPGYFFFQAANAGCKCSLCEFFFI